MSVSRGVSPVIWSIVGIVILVSAVVLIVSLVSSEPPVKELIYKTSELRTVKDPVDRADLITEIDDVVAASGDESIYEQWDRMLECLTTECPDEAFLDMVLVTVVAFEQDINDSALLINVIATAKYWGKEEHMLDFSKALSTANDQIEELDRRSAEKIWEDIVECKGECPEMFDLYFELIKTIAE